MFSLYCFCVMCSVTGRAVHQWVDWVSTRGQGNTKHSAPAACGEITPHMMFEH